MFRRMMSVLNSVPMTSPSLLIPTEVTFGRVPFTHIIGVNPFPKPKRNRHLVPIPGPGLSRSIESLNLDSLSSPRTLEFHPPLSSRETGARRWNPL